MLKLLLVENQKIIYGGIDFLLRSYFKRLQLDVISGGDRLDYPRRSRPSVILLGCGQGSSVDATCLQIGKVLSSYPKVPLVIYNYSSDYTTVTRYFKEGVSGYLSIDSESDQLVDCIQTVLKGYKYISVEMLLHVIGRVESDPLVAPAKTTSLFDKLSRREREIAGYISNGARTVELAKILHVRPSTISTVKANILRKLNVKNVVELSRAVAKNKISV
jgi:two-component system invasion response regulator UvrY